MKSSTALRDVQLTMLKAGASTTKTRTAHANAGTPGFCMSFHQNQGRWGHIQDGYRGLLKFRDYITVLFKPSHAIHVLRGLRLKWSVAHIRNSDQRGLKAEGLLALRKSGHSNEGPPCHAGTPQACSSGLNNCPYSSRTYLRQLNYTSEVPQKTIGNYLALCVTPQVKPRQCRVQAAWGS